VDFYTLCISGNSNEYYTKRRKIYNLTDCLIVAALCDWLLPAVHLVELVVHHFSRKSFSVCLFSIFVREFPVESLGRKYFGFPQVLIKILSSELVIIMHEVA